MCRKILNKFIKDRALLICFYIINMVSVIAFFHLSESRNQEFFYPLSIGIFLLILYLVIDWLIYYQINRAIEQKLKNQFVEIEPHTEEQKAFQRLLNKNIREHTGRYNKMREQNKERYYFISRWMHHLKTPVSVIELIVEKEEINQETSIEALKLIKQENKRLHTSIEQGLTMIRMESFENDLEPRAIDLVGSLRKIINNRKHEFIYNQLYPSIEFEEESAVVVTDEKWNEILLDQLISNAIKYSYAQDGSKKIFFRIVNEEGNITLSIIDKGVGIPKYDIDRVFELFFTGENGRRFRNSSGIGLYLCKKISENLGHTLTIQSEVSKGTEVQVTYLTKL
ncbi:sensor histidine kinase [Bacillaceae bacterium W0354]